MTQPSPTAVERVEPVTTLLDRGHDRIAIHSYPDPDPSAPLAVIWPAMGVPARYYRPLATRLGEAGLGVVVVDLRGTGASTPTPSRASRHGLADLVADVEAVHQRLAAQRTDRSVLLVGHSLGGQAALLHQALHPESRVDGLALVAVGLPYWRRYPGPRSLGVLAVTQGIAAITAALRVWPGWAFGGRQARGVIRDWGFTARHGRYPALGAVDATAVADAVARLDLPVLGVSVAPDQFTPAPTVDHLLGALTAATVERVHVPTAAADVPLDHFAWVRASAPFPALLAEFAHGLRRRA